MISYAFHFCDARPITKSVVQATYFRSFGISACRRNGENSVGIPFHGMIVHAELAFGVRKRLQQSNSSSTPA
jgi:hypothetical protein